MSIANMAIATAPLADGEGAPAGGRKPPIKRTIMAVADTRIAPEPR